MVKEINYVIFLSPGTFVSETSKKEIDGWDIKEALKISKKITERHNAKPYGFRFEQYKSLPPVKSDGETFNVEQKFVKSSGTYYITGKILNLGDIPDTKENEILRSNMRCSKIKAVIENKNSYKFTGEFGDKDTLVDWNGNILDKGSNYK